MVTEALAIAKAAFSALRKPFEKGARRALVWSFQRRTRKPPLDDATANQVAYSVLAGDIMCAKSYRNMDSPHVFVAVMRRTSERDNDPKVYVLEQMGKAFKVAWKSDPLHSTHPLTLDVLDVDGDGNREVIFEDQSYGTGGGSRRLM